MLEVLAYYVPCGDAVGEASGGVWLWLLVAGQGLLAEAAPGRTKSWGPGVRWGGEDPGSGQPLISTMGMSTMELVMDGGQLLACSLASGGEQAALGWPLLGVVLLGTWLSLALVHGDTGPRLWRLEEELAGLSKDLEDDCGLEMLERRRDWLL